MLEAQPPTRSASTNGSLYRGFFRAYGLNENPFGISPDPKYLLHTPQIQEAFAELMVGITRRKGFMLLSGETGTGKTTVLNSLQDWLRAQEIPAAFVFNPNLQSDQLLEYVIAGFGVPADPSKKLGARALLYQWLLDVERRGQTAVVILDEAQGLAPSLLEEMRLQLTFESHSEPLLQVILAGQPELEQKLRGPDLRQFWQRMTLRCRMVPLTQDQTLAYISSRLRAGGAKDDKLFSQGAVSAIYSYSLGIPRIMNLLCEHALINAYVENARPISARIVDEVAREFDLGSVRSGSRSGESAESEEWFSPAALARAVSGNRNSETPLSQPIAFVTGSRPVEITECAAPESDFPLTVSFPDQIAESSSATPELAAALPDPLGALDDLFQTASQHPSAHMEPLAASHQPGSVQIESASSVEPDEFDSTLHDLAEPVPPDNMWRIKISPWRSKIASAVETARLHLRAASLVSFDWLRDHAIIFLNWMIDVYYASKDATTNVFERMKESQYRDTMREKFYAALDFGRASFQRAREISHSVAGLASQRARVALQQTHLAANKLPSVSHRAVRWLRQPIGARRPVRGTHFAPVKKTS